MERVRRPDLSSARLVGKHGHSTEGWGDLPAIAKGFDSARLAQARRLSGLTKRALAQLLGVSPAAVGQWEAGTTAPRPDHVGRLAEELDVPPAFFAAGRLYVRLDVGSAHFRSLRSTPAAQRAKAIAFVEQVWELAYAIERRVELPPVDLPATVLDEVISYAAPERPRRAARLLRRYWQLDNGPIPHLVRLLEKRGIIVTLVPFAGSATAKVDAFSTSHLPRPLIVLTPDRANDVYRHRFTAAHELGHLLLHGDVAPGDPLQEKEADVFAAEFLTPEAEIVPQLPARMDLAKLDRISREWGVGVESLVYRCHEVGVLSEASYRRAFQRLNQLRTLGLFRPEPVEHYPGEIPALLMRAFSVACDHGLTMTALSNELKIKSSRLRMLLGQVEPRPQLRVVVGEEIPG